MSSLQHEATVQLLSREALDHIDELVAGIIDDLVEPSGFFDQASLADLRVSAREGIVSLIAVLAGVTSIDEGPLDLARTFGRRQVQQDLELEGLLRGYRMAGQVVWDHLVTTARASHAHVGDALLDGASYVWRVIDLLCAAATEAYRAEEGQLRDRDERVQATVLVALLEGRGADPQFARDACHALGVPTSGPFVCVVGLAEPADTLPLDSARARLKTGGISSAWATLPGSDVGLVALGPRGAVAVREQLDAAVRTRAGMSPVFSDLAELPRARHLAQTAARCPGEGRAVRELDDDLVAGLLIDAPLVASMLYEQTVGALLAGAGPDGSSLLGTLQAFLAADGSLTTAAAQSYVHRNTMLYRLNKIEKITGLSVRNLPDQLRWVIALKQHAVRQG